MRKPLTEMDDWTVSDEDKDIRGWEVRASDGRILGKVRELIADTDTQHVESIVLDNGTEIAVSSLEIGDREVHVLAGADRDGSRAANGKPERGSQEIRIPIVEERIKVGKREVTRDAVRVHTSVTEKPVEEGVTLRKTEVHVDRHPVDRPASEADLKNAGKQFEFTSTNEVPVVEKTARVVGEVVISKDVTQKEETIRGTVRKTEVKVDELNDGGKRSSDRHP